jgi:hypothetical protein
MPRLRLRLSTLALLIVITALTLVLVIQQQRLRTLERELDRLKRQMEMEGVILGGSSPRSPTQPPGANTPVGTGW